MLGRLLRILGTDPTTTGLDYSPETSAYSSDHKGIWAGGLHTFNSASNREQAVPGRLAQQIVAWRGGRNAWSLRPAGVGLDKSSGGVGTVSPPG